MSTARFGFIAPTYHNTSVTLHKSCLHNSRSKLLSLVTRARRNQASTSDYHLVQIGADTGVRELRLFETCDSCCHCAHTNRHCLLFWDGCCCYTCWWNRFCEHGRCSSACSSARPCALHRALALPSRPRARPTPTQHRTLPTTTLQHGRGHEIYAPGPSDSMRAGGGWVAGWLAAGWLAGWRLAPRLPSSFVWLAVFVSAEHPPASQPASLQPASHRSQPAKQEAPSCKLVASGQ